jgi:branched-chain amino acid aminotransferase group I
MEDIIYLNGALVPRSQALVSVLDHAFLYGYGLYESMRAYHGRIFLLERHIQRMRDAAGMVGLADKLAKYDVIQACRDTLAINKLGDARIRVTVSNGAADAPPWTDNGGPPNVVVTARPYTPFPAAKYEEGFRVGIASARRCRQSVAATLKTVSHLTSVMARMETAAAGLDEALLLNETGHIAEGGGCNVFFVKKGGLLTPPLDSGILPGVTRGLVMEIAKGSGLGMAETDIDPAALGRFDEVFVTNAMIEVMPVTAVRDSGGRMVTIGNGKPGMITRCLMQDYRDRVEKATAAGGNIFFIRF